MCKTIRADALDPPIASVRDDLSTLTADPAQAADSLLLLLDDRRGQEGGRAGMAPGCTLSCYHRLVDWTSRLVREKKANLDPAAAPTFVRLGIESSAWDATK
jgi:hypothetical protein